MTNKTHRVRYGQQASVETDAFTCGCAREVTGNAFNGMSAKLRERLLRVFDDRFADTKGPIHFKLELTVTYPGDGFVGYEQDEEEPDDTATS